MKPTRIVVVLLTILLLASGVLNLVLYSRGDQYYRQLNEVRLDPVGLSYYAVGQSPPASQQKQVVFFGDSRATEWVVPPGFEQFQFVNRGIHNQTSAQVLERFDEHVAPLHPQIVVLQVGVNDLKAIPLFPDRKAAIVATCKRNIEEIVATSRECGATVILTTIFPLGKVPLERRLFWSDDVAQAIDEVNAFLHSLGGEGVVVLDTAAVLTDDGRQVREEYSRDLLHLDELGYKALNQELERILSTLEK